MWDEDMDSGEDDWSVDSDMISESTSFNINYRHE